MEKCHEISWNAPTDGLEQLMAAMAFSFPLDFCSLGVISNSSLQSHGKKTCKQFDTSSKVSGSPMFRDIKLQMTMTLSVASNGHR